MEGSCHSRKSDIARYRSLQMPHFQMFDKQGLTLSCFVETPLDVLAVADPIQVFGDGAVK